MSGARSSAACVQRLVAALLAGLLGGCAPAARVVLLPQADSTALEVRTANRTQVLTQPYHVAAVSARGEVSVDTTTPEKVREQFPRLLALQPPAAQRYVLYFEPGGAQLTAESEARLTEVLAGAAARPGGEIIVTGHTDRVGTLESNDALSLQWVSAIRAVLL
jgi:OmpA-OmpF porin, OOP family